MTEFDEDNLLTEVFNLGTAKGYAYTVSAPGEYPADPAITFQSVFKDDHGTEFAFRVYKANLIQGTGQRKYGKHTRVLAFMRRKTKNFAQNITIDAGTFKKVLVTFMQSYEAYKDTKDGALASSYAIILQSSLKNYASLFVRATVRAFKANRKLHMSLYGVQEDGVGGSIELLYVNPQTIYPYWGGPEFDEAAFVGNPTHVALAKLEGTVIAPAGGLSPVDAAADSNTGAKSVASTTPQAAAVVAPAVVLPDPMNNPTAFNATLFNRLHFAKGRDDFAAILREVRVHRKYVQDHFATMFNELYVDKPLAQVFDKVNMAHWEAGMGFYLKRYDETAHAYISVFVAGQEDVFDMVKALNGLTNEISKLKSGFGKVRTGGVISELLISIRQKVIDATIEVLADSTPNTVFRQLKANVHELNTSFDGTGLGSGISGISTYLQRSNINLPGEDVVKAMTLLYFFDVASASSLIGIIQSYEPKAGATVTFTAYAVKNYDKLFTQSTEIIDKLMSTFPTVSIVKFGTQVGVEDRLVTLFKTNFDQFGREMNNDNYDPVALAKSLAEATATLSKDRVEETFENVIGDYVLGYRVDANLKATLKAAYLKYIGDLPANERFGFDAERKLLGWYSNKSYGASTAGDAAALYFNKRIGAFYDLWLTRGINYHTNANDIKSMVPDFDIGDYWEKIKRRFTIPGGRESQDFFSAIFNVSIAPLMSAEQLMDVVNSGFFKADELLNLYNRGATNAIEAYTRLGGTLNSYISNQRISYNFVNKVDAVKVLYDAATPGEQITARDKLMPLIGIGLVQQLSDIVGKDVVDSAIIKDPSMTISAASSSAQTLFGAIGPKAADAVIEHLSTSPITSYQLPMASGIVSGLDKAKTWGELSAESLKSLFRMNNKYHRSEKPAVRAEFEAANSRFIIESWKKDAKMGEEMFSILKPEDRKLVAKGVLSEKFVKTTREELAGDSVPIKPLVDLDEARIAQILKYNDIKVPRAPQVRDDTTLTDIMSKVVDKADINKLAVTEETKTADELEQMSVEYDAFNRYRHGNIAVKIIKSFTVSIPVQETGFEAWQAKMAAEGTDSKVLRPVFHGTGSVAASMILRYGFKVIKSSDASVVGRMLGDGIYFSNVIDKVSQYMSDGGYSRGVGIKGYIFEMEASLGKYKRDYNAAGPGTGHDSTRVISPEWAVFNANDQIRIYKAYQCELVDKSTMDMLKAKRGVNENTSVVGIQHFKGFVNEAIGDKMKNKVVYIFMDGTIPVSKHKSVDFEDFDPKKYGKHVQTDWSGSGPTVQIDTNGPGGVFCVRYTNQLMHDAAKLEKFIDLLNGK